MRKLVQLLARMPAAATVAATAFLLVTPAAAQDVPSKPAKKAPAKRAPAQKAPAKKAPAQKAPAKKAPAPVVVEVPQAVEAPSKRAFAEPPEMVPPELEEPEMTGAPESLEKENARSEPRLDPLRPSTVRRARLGAVVGPADISKTLARFGIESGILVKELIEGTPAHLDGMLVGDIITRVEGKPIAKATDAVNALSGHAPGKVAVVQVVRDGKPILLRLKLDQGTKVVKRSSRRKSLRRRHLHHQRRRMNMRQWRRDLRRRHQLRMRQLNRRRF